MIQQGASGLPNVFSNSLSKLVAASFVAGNVPAAAANIGTGTPTMNVDGLAVTGGPRSRAANWRRHGR
ncbi:MAG: hypothetical protein KGL48_16115 [Sphingomonadales bacterium]|nr:hypothetical protein [Sphingomonadales bacterium]MDE2569126.1 hypothetical protein [Sphingomonadales bacterium]